MSSFGGAGNGYQPFTFPQLKGAPLNEKVQESDSDRSGNLGFGMTEKEIDDRVRVYSLAPPECIILFYSDFFTIHLRMSVDI
jgi:hypothetical protein